MNVTKKILAIGFVLSFAVKSYAQNPLMIPPVLTGPVYNLEVRMDSTEFITGHKSPTYGVNGNILGPTLIFNKWDTVTLNVTNHINSTTTMHWHGMHVPAIYDGGPHQMIMQNTTWSPSYRVLNDAATFWYHPHGQGKTDLQVSRGVAGLIIVRDSAEAALTLPRTYGVDDIPLIIQSKAFDVLYQIAIATANDSLPVINATVNPKVDVPAQVVRLRCLNGSSERSYMLGFSNNMTFYQIATDGGLRDSSLALTSLLLAPGERSEILVDLSSMQGQTVNLMNLGTQIPNGVIGAANVGGGMAQIPGYSSNPLNGADYQLLQMNVVAPTANPVTTIPAALVPHTPWNPNASNHTRMFSFAPQNSTTQGMVEGPFVINNHQFSMTVINDTVYLNNIEIWSLFNGTLVGHPFHIHDVQFYVNDIDAQAPPAYMKGKKDVVMVKPQETLTFITKFEDFADTVPYMYHCHLLHHEDDGMMGSFIVLDSSSTGIDEQKYISGTLYPNPVNQAEIRVTKMNDLSGDYIITDITGKIVLRGYKKPGVELAINVAALQSGTYILKFANDNTQIDFKFVKQ